MTTVVEYYAEMAKLEAWADVGREICRPYYPSVFESMRIDPLCGTKKAMEILGGKLEIQYGLRALGKLGLEKEWSIEAGIIKFEIVFPSKELREIARFKLKIWNDPAFKFLWSSDRE